MSKQGQENGLASSFNNSKANIKARSHSLFSFPRATPIVTGSRLNSEMGHTLVPKSEALSPRGHTTLNRWEVSLAAKQKDLGSIRFGSTFSSLQKMWFMDSLVTLPTQLMKH